MMYPFMTLNDDTEITHSETREDEHGEYVMVCVETPVYGGFHSAWCRLPEYKWSDIDGFKDADMAKFTEIIESTAHLIMKFARQGGFENASNF